MYLVHFLLLFFQVIGEFLKAVVSIMAHYHTVCTV